jgi:ornithine decarboxylase
MALAAGATPDRISFGNTIKKERDIARAHALGVALRRRFGRGSGEDRARCARCAGVLPHPHRWCRRRVAAVAQVRLRARDGGGRADARPSLGLDAYGISFHVGSQQTQPRGLGFGAGQSKAIFDAMQARGITCRW